MEKKEEKGEGVNLDRFEEFISDNNNKYTMAAEKVDDIINSYY